MTAYWIFVGLITGFTATHLGYRLWAREADQFRFRALLQASRAIPAGTVLQFHYPKGGTEAFCKQNGMQYTEPAKFDRYPNPALEAVADNLVDSVNRVTALCGEHEGRDVPAADVMKALLGDEEA